MNQQLFNWLSLIGSIASITGIIVTFYQVKSVKEISRQTQRSLNKVNVISEISKCNEIVKEITRSLKSENFEHSLDKMRDVKDMIIKIKVWVTQLQHPNIDRSFRENIDTHIAILTNSINDIDDNHRTPHLLNKTGIMNKMDKLSSYIVEIQALLSNEIDN